jgi:hypothetical protein
MWPLAWNNFPVWPIALAPYPYLWPLGRVDVTSLHEGTGTVLYDKPSSAYVAVTVSASHMPPAKILSNFICQYKS